jgi:hypothetical protein
MSGKCIARTQRDSRNITVALAAITLLIGCMKAGSPGGSAAEAPAFPWPPPEASAAVNLTEPLLASHKPFVSLGEANTVLQTALRQAGYVETSYFAVPDGFALVSRLEKTEPDGASRPENDRWSIALPKMARFTLREYLRALFTANEGHYRMMVFVVTDMPLTQSGHHVTSWEAETWLREGRQGLPPSIAQLPWTPATTCTALIYEFVREQRDTEPRVVVPGEHGGMTHLKLAGTSGMTTPKLWGALGLSQ